MDPNERMSLALNLMSTDTQSNLNMVVDDVNPPFVSTSNAMLEGEEDDVVIISDTAELDDHRKKVESFCGVANCDEETGRHLLEVFYDLIIYIYIF